LELSGYVYPFVKLVAHVSSGTYIRTLAEDIGRKLGTGAYTLELRRTKVGNFDIKNAHVLTDLGITD
jgi:tRNA pseudouridine55 synthase